ncbi:MAG: lipoyl(octanoyl) transferase LipB [Deltaproteobacteria bacterium]|nr:lipoyl(octanoyl) transferase LipB [Deltaproteobacteria bacterium]
MNRDSYLLALDVYYLGMRDFLEVRQIQKSFLELRIAGQVRDTLIFCEHPPTITIGNRASVSELKSSLSDLRASGVEVVKTNRGGGITYHGPGQVMLYPVISLRERRLGVRSFVSVGLRSISDFLDYFGIVSQPLLDPAGVWVMGNGIAGQNRKIAAVGLRIDRGVTDHGFCVNIDCELDIYGNFNPCFVPGMHITSVVKELGHSSISIPSFGESVARLRNCFECRLK